MHPEQVEVTQVWPGRIRLHVPHLWSDPERAADIRRALDLYPGVESVKLGLLTSTVTVEFNPDDGRSVLDCLEQIFPGAGLEEVDLDHDREETLPTAIATGHPARPTRDQARARAAARRRNLATVGITVAGVVAGLVARRLLRGK